MLFKVFELKVVKVVKVMVGGKKKVKVCVCDGEVWFVEILKMNGMCVLWGVGVDVLVWWLVGEWMVVGF